MATTNPRVNVTLSPGLNTLVEQLAKYERVSKAMVLRELLEAAEPSLRHAVALMAAAQGASAAARQRVVEGLDASIEQSERLAKEMLGMMGKTTADLFEAEETVKGRRPAAAQVKRAPVAVAQLASKPAKAASNPPNLIGGSSRKKQSKPGRVIS